MRKVGAVMSPAARMAKPAIRLIHQIRQFIRRDFGGVSDQQKFMINKFADFAKKRGHAVSAAGSALVADFMLEELSHQVAGIRKRIEPSLVDMERRIQILACIDPNASEHELRRAINMVVNGDSQDNDLII